MGWWAAPGVLLGFQAAMVALAVRDRRRASAVLNHALVVDRALAGICAEAFMAQHLPVWRAWAPAMGDYEVRVTPTRKAWDDGT
jgi:hypothetical protein